MHLPTPPMVITIERCICDNERPEHVHRYGLMAQIGEGGMGTVYKAVDHDPPKWYRRIHGDAERLVVVKYLKQSVHTDPSEAENIRARFRREAESVIDIDHRNVVGVYNFNEDHEKRLLIVMEYVPNPRELAAYIAELKHEFNQGIRRNPLTRKIQTSLTPPEKLFPILKQLLQALDVLHSRKLVHRDLKPENCLLMGDILRLTDFGIVKLLDTEEPDELEARPISRKKLTVEGAIIGTPYYMAPEQTGVPITDPETNRTWGVGTYTDIWAFGVIAYEMISGELPFFSEKLMGILSRIANDQIPPDPLTDYVEDLPKELERFVMRCLTHNPWERPSTVAEVQKLLERAEEALRRSDGTATVSSLPPSADDASDDEDLRSSVRHKQLRAIPPPKLETGDKKPWVAAVGVLTGVIVALIGWIALREPGGVPVTQAGVSTADPSSSVSTPRAEPAKSTVMAYPTTDVAASVATAASVPTSRKRTPEPAPSPASSIGKELREGLVAYDRKQCYLAERKMNLVLVAHPAYPEPIRILALCALRKGNKKAATEYAAKYNAFEGVAPLPPELAALL